MDALNAVWRVERLLWGSSLKRKIRNKRSRFYRNIPKVGIAACALSWVGNLWTYVALLFAVSSAVSAIWFGRGTITPRALALVGIAFFGLGIFRMRRAKSKISRQF